MFETVLNPASAEIVEKKSKFIANIYHVESVDEAEEILRQLRKKYHDARHNCYAYKIVKDDISRASDDGEPSGTAGVPMLNILNGRELSNILIVVTRYFGGILLGTGGLVRAYSKALNTVIEKSELVKQELGLEMKFYAEYKDLEEIRYQMKNRGIEITNLIYDEKIEVTVVGSKEKIEKIKGEKISDRIVLDNIIQIQEKYVFVVD